jgi:dTDP-glucose 4,6-dehydratase
MLVLAWARTYNMKYVILRPTNNYGIGQYPEKLIPICVKHLQRGRKIRLHDAGEPIRNWLHSADTAEAVVKIIEFGATNEIYNVAGGFEQKNFDTAEQIIRNYFDEQYPDVLKHLDLGFKRPGQDVRYALNDEKLRSLEWNPKKIFYEELPMIVEYYKNNFKW